MEAVRSKAPDATSDDRPNNQIITVVCKDRMTINDLEKIIFIMYGLIISRENGSGS